MITMQRMWLLRLREIHKIGLRKSRHGKADLLEIEEDPVVTSEAPRVPMHLDNKRCDLCNRAAVTAIKPKDLGGLRFCSLLCATEWREGEV